MNPGSEDQPATWAGYSDQLVTATYLRDQNSVRLRDVSGVRLILGNFLSSGQGDDAETWTSDAAAPVTFSAGSEDTSASWQ